MNANPWGPALLLWSTIKKGDFLWSSDTWNFDPSWSHTEPSVFLNTSCGYTSILVCRLEKKKQQQLEESSHSFLTSGVMAIIYGEKSVLVTTSCLTLCNPMDCSLSDSSVHEILRAKILEWVDIPFSRRSSWPRDWTQASCITGGFFNHLSHQGSPLYMAEKPNGNFQNY